VVEPKVKAEQSDIAIPKPSALVVAGRIALAAGLIWLILWSVRGLNFDLTHSKKGVLSAADYVGRMFPKDAAERRDVFDVLRNIWAPLKATIQMAVFGTALGALLAFPISFIAARTASVPTPVSVAIKSLLNIGRAVPTLVYALVVVSSIGLGPSAGAIALAFSSFVYLAKLFAEALESVSQGPLEAVRAAGGNGFQVFVFGMLPQVFPLYLSTMLYALEHNFKDSSVLGIVGAGGLGFELVTYLNYYQLAKAGLIIAVIILSVNLVDYLSFRVRKIFS
jgi:phosphonate transport system permease protein